MGHKNKGAEGEGRWMAKENKENRRKWGEAVDTGKEFNNI